VITRLPRIAWILVRSRRLKNPCSAVEWWWFHIKLMAKDVNLSSKLEHQFILVYGDKFRLNSDTEWLRAGEGLMDSTPARSAIVRATLRIRS